MTDAPTDTAPRKARRKPTNLLRLTKQWLLQRGAVFEDMERRIPGTWITKDGFGFIDLVAIINGSTFGLQVCRSSDAANRIQKILTHENFPKVARAWTIVVIAWREIARQFGPPAWVPRIIECKEGDAIEAAQHPGTGADEPGGQRQSRLGEVAAAPAAVRRSATRPQDGPSQDDRPRRSRRADRSRARVADGTEDSSLVAGLPFPPAGAEDHPASPGGQPGDSPTTGEVTS